MQQHGILRALLVAALLLPGGALAATSYRVKSGDTLSGIAVRSGVTVAQLQAANARLKNSTAVQAGWVLTIPARRLPATTHRVQEGQNLTTIARKYGLSVTGLAAANPKWRGRALWVGALLNIPARSASQSGAGQSGASQGGAGQIGASVRTASVAAPAQTPMSSGNWVWPLKGYATISSGFGGREFAGQNEVHYGIDIVAPEGTPVRAARAGRVLESRPDYDRGWGWTVVIEHEDGWITRYAHLSANLTRKGEWVVRGQRIGRVGDTGRSTGPHLHFGTYFRWAPRDPMALY